MGIRVAPEFIPQVKQALKHRFPNQQALADEILLCLSSVNSFLNGKPVHFLNFIEICHKLGLDWQAIADRQLAEPLTGQPPEIRLRSSCRDAWERGKGKGNEIFPFFPSQEPLIPSQEPPPSPISTKFMTACKRSIDALVQKVRGHCYDKIHQLYGKMQLVDISQPIDVDNLYG